MNTFNTAATRTFPIKNCDANFTYKTNVYHVFMLKLHDYDCSKGVGTLLQFRRVQLSLLSIQIIIMKVLLINVQNIIKCMVRVKLQLELSY